MSVTLIEKHQTPQIKILYCHDHEKAKSTSDLPAQEGEEEVNDEQGNYKQDAPTSSYSLPTTLASDTWNPYSILVNSILLLSNELQKTRRFIESATESLNEKAETSNPTNLDQDHHSLNPIVGLWKIIINEAISDLKSTRNLVSFPLSSQNTSLLQREKHDRRIQYKLMAFRLKIAQLLKFTKQLQKQFHECSKIFQQLIHVIERKCRNNIETVRSERKIAHKCQQHERSSTLQNNQHKDEDVHAMLHVQWGSDGLSVKSSSDTATWVNFSNCSPSHKLSYVNIFMYNLSRIADFASNELIQAKNLLFTSSSPENKSIQSKLDELLKFVKHIYNHHYHHVFSPREQVLILQTCWDMKDALNELSQGLDKISALIIGSYKVTQDLKYSEGKSKRKQQLQLAGNTKECPTFQLTISKAYFDVDEMFRKPFFDISDGYEEISLNSPSVCSSNSSIFTPVPEDENLISVQVQLTNNLSQLLGIETQDQIKSEYSLAFEQILDTNQLEVEQVKLCSDPVKQFYFVCNRITGDLKENIATVNRVIEQFSLDVDDELNGMQVRTFLTIRLILLSFEKMDTRWFSQVEAVVDECDALAIETFKQIDIFQTEFEKEANRLIRFADYVRRCGDYQIRRDLLLDGKSIEHLIAFVKFKSDEEDLEVCSPAQPVQVDKREVFITLHEEDCCIYTIADKELQTETRILKSTYMEGRQLCELTCTFIGDMIDTLRVIKSTFCNMHNCQVSKIKKAMKTIIKSCSLRNLHDLEKITITTCLKALQVELTTVFAHTDKFEGFIADFKSLLEFPKTYITTAPAAKKNVEAYLRMQDLQEVATMIESFELFQYQPSDNRNGYLNLKKRLLGLLDENGISLLQASVFRKANKHYTIWQFSRSLYYIRKIADNPSIKLSTLYPNQLATLRSSDSIISATKNSTTTIEVNIQQILDDFQNTLDNSFLESLRSISVPASSDSKLKCQSVGFLEGLAFLIYSIGWTLKDRIPVSKQVLLKLSFEKLLRDISQIRKLEMQATRQVASKFNVYLSSMMAKNLVEMERAHPDSMTMLQDVLSTACSPNRQHLLEYIWKPYEEAPIHDNQDGEIELANSVNNEQSLEIYWNSLYPQEVQLRRQIDSSSPIIANSFESLSPESKIKLLFVALNKLEIIMDRSLKCVSNIAPCIQHARKHLVSLNEYLRSLESVRPLPPEQIYVVLQTVQNEINLTMSEWAKMHLAVTHSQFYIYNSFREICGGGIGRRTISERNPFFYAASISVTLQLWYEIGENEQISLEAEHEQLFPDDEDWDSDDDDEFPAMRDSQEIEPLAQLPTFVSQSPEPEDKFKTESSTLSQLLESDVILLSATLNYPSASFQPTEQGDYSQSMAIVCLIGHATVEIKRISNFQATKPGFALSKQIHRLSQRLKGYNRVHKSYLKLVASKIDKTLLKMSKLLKINEEIPEPEPTPETWNIAIESSNYGTVDNADLTTIRSGKALLLGWTDVETGLFIQAKATQKVYMFENISEARQNQILRQLMEVLDNTINSLIKIQVTRLIPNFKRVNQMLKANKKIWKSQLASSNSQDKIQFCKEKTTILESLIYGIDETKFILSQTQTCVDKLLTNLAFIESYTKMKTSSEMLNRKRFGKQADEDSSTTSRLKNKSAQQVVYEKKLVEMESVIQTEFPGIPISVTIEFNTVSEL